MRPSAIQIPDSTVLAIDMEYDVENILWRTGSEYEDRAGRAGKHDRGTSLLTIMSDDFKIALRAMHRHVILSNAMRKRHNLAQILLLVGYGGGFSEVLPVDDIASEIFKEGAAGDGDLKILCHWNINRNGEKVFQHQPGRLIEVKRLIKIEELRARTEELIAIVDLCAAEADLMGGTWLQKRV